MLEWKKETLPMFANVKKKKKKKKINIITKPRWPKMIDDSIETSGRSPNYSNLTLIKAFRPLASGRYWIYAFQLQYNTISILLFLVVWSTCILHVSNKYPFSTLSLNEYSVQSTSLFHTRL